MSKISSHPQRLQDRVALVTGSGRGLGAATALRFAEEGAHVVINDLNSASAQETSAKVIALGRKSFVSSHDVSVTAQARELFEQIRSQFGQLDLLVNNAGITRDALLHKMSEEKFDEVIRVNVKGVFNGIQLGSALMVEKKRGRIINLSSVAALGNVGQTNYSASKAAVIGMTRTAALELARHGITVNAIGPGFFDSALTQVIPPEVKEKLLQRVPLKRIGRPEEIGALAAYLASDEAAYLTGQTIFIDGGLTDGISVY